MARLSQENNSTVRIAATIAEDAAVSGPINLSDLGPRGLAVAVPGEWTAANLGFDVSADGQIWTPLFDKVGARVKITTIAVAAERLYVAPPEAWAVGAWPFLRLASLDTADDTAEAQVAARALTVVLMS